MKIDRVAIAGLSQRIAHVIRATAATGGSLEIGGFVDPSASTAPAPPWRRVDAARAGGAPP